jgi:predicted alpha-1,6-mannanase (GH76 family)
MRIGWVVGPLVIAAAALSCGSSSNPATPAGADAGPGDDASRAPARDGGPEASGVACPAPGSVPSDAPLAACTAPGYGDDLLARDDGALLALGGFFDSSTGRFGTAWWQAANALEAAETSYGRTNGLAGGYFFVATHARLGADSAYINYYFDDEGWWGNTWVHAYDLTGNASYLATAKSIFADIATGWDATCKGGVWWSKARTYKNAIPNELFLLLAASLHNRTAGDGGGGSYLDWAQKEWAWFSASGMINAKNLVNDGLNACANNGGTTWTYNQGVVLAGLLELRRATGDDSLIARAESIADAALATLVDANGILTEPCPGACGGGDVPQFKGVFTRSLQKLFEVDGKSAYRDFLAKNAHSIWTKARNANDQLGLAWDAPFDSADVTRQNSAEVTLSAAAPTRTTAGPFVRPSGDPSFCHPLGGGSGTAAWSCDGIHCPQPGFMQVGPGVTYLSSGAHTAHVRLSVDSLRAGTCVLAEVQVRSTSDGGVPLAKADVAWEQFPAAGAETDFSLPYVVPTQGDAVEVRVYWFAQPGAPKLTVHDVAFDAPHAWTAANLSHDVGRMGARGTWMADPIEDKKPGLLVHGPATAELAAGPTTVFFEMAVDDFSTPRGTIATVSAVDDTTATTVAHADVARADFPDGLLHLVPLAFTASAGDRYDFDVSWPATAGSPRLTVRGIYALQGTRAAVPLPYNVRGIGTAAGDASLDGAGNALSSAQLPSPLPVGLRTYALGSTAAGASNVLSAEGQTLALPSGSFRAIRILALATNGTQATQSFTITHSDGTKSTVVRSISDWAAASTQADEALAWAMPLRLTQTGTDYATFRVYEYVLPIDTGKVATTLALPAAPNIKVLAASMEESD